MIADVVRRAVDGDRLDRQLRIRTAWEAYAGDRPAPLQPARSRDGRVLWRDDVPVNFSKLVVDTSVDFLFGKPVTFEIDSAADTTGPSEAQMWLDDVWHRNRQPQVLHDLAMNGAVCGHAFAKILPPTDGQSWPRVTIVDPANVDMTCDPEDVDTIVQYVIEWSAVDAQRRVIQRRQTIMPDDIGRQWRIVDEQSSADYGDWWTVSDVVWPYPWPPIVHCKNLPAPNMMWGMADLEQSVIDLDHALRFLLSNMVRIVRYHAHPRTIAKGMRAKDLQSGPDEVLVLPAPTSDVYNLEMQSDLSSSLNVYGTVKEALHQIAQIPEIASGKVDNIGTLSGVALSILYEPLLRLTNVKRTLYGHLLETLNTRLLDLGGHGEDVQVSVHWPELLPKDSMAEAQTATVLQSLGVSVSTLLQQLGYDPDLEADRRTQDPSRAGTDLLRAFASADTVPGETL